MLDFEKARSTRMTLILEKSLRLRERRNRSVEEYLRIAKLFRIATKVVETYGFISLCLGFTFFNLVYWPWLIISSNYGAFTVNFTFNEPIMV